MASYEANIRKLAPKHSLESLFMIETNMSSNWKIIKVSYNLSLQRFMVKNDKSQTAPGPPSFAQLYGIFWQLASLTGFV